MSTDEKPSAALIAAGKCPGWTYSMEYDADTKYGRPCGKPTTRGDLCGNHDNRRKKETERLDAHAARSAAHLKSRELAESLSRYFGALFYSGQGYVSIDNDSAQRLLDGLS